jgi:hypothetical protein
MPLLHRQEEEHRNAGVNLSSHNPKMKRHTLPGPKLSCHKIIIVGKKTIDAQRLFAGNHCGFAALDLFARKACENRNCFDP